MWRMIVRSYLEDMSSNTNSIEVNVAHNFGQSTSNWSMDNEQLFGYGTRGSFYLSWVGKELLHTIQITVWTFELCLRVWKEKIGRF